MQPSAAPYPATFTFDPPEKVTNWRPLVNWLLAIPHFAVLYGLRVLGQVIAVISWFAIVFTGNMPDSLANIQAMWIRYEQRTYTFAAFMREDYPPFAFATVTADDGKDPLTRVDVQPVFTDRNRLTVGLRIFYVIPHVIALIGLGIYASILVLINFFIVLFTGAWNPGMRDTVIKVMRWYVRVQAYFLLLTDEYPPFQLD
jgi:hypothetical protein